MSEQDEDDVER